MRSPDKTNRDDEGECPEDLTPQPPSNSAEDLKTKVDALYQAMLRDIAENGSDWPVVTGPGK